MKFNMVFLSLLMAAVVAHTSVPVAYAVDKEGQESGIAQDKTVQQADSKEEKQAVTANVAGSYLSSRFARDTGNVDLAISRLRQVHAEEPENNAVALQLQGLLLVQGHIEEAIGIAQQIDRNGTKDPLVTLLLALNAIRNKDTDSALAILDRASANGNQQLWQPLIQAWIDIDQHKLEKPLTLEQVTSDAGHAGPLVSYHLALINSQGGFKDEAIKNFKAAIIDPKDPPMRVMKQLLRFYDQNDAPEQLASIVKEYRESHAGAGADVENDGGIPAITTMKDGVGEILYTMGGIMFGAGVTNDAAIYLQLALFIKPDLTEATVALGDTYSELQQYGRANELYAKVTPQNLLYTKAKLHIAVNTERMGKLRESLNLLDQMAKELPQAAPEALVTKGDLLRIHQNYPEAVEAYTAAMKHIPELKSMYWPLLFARGACYEREGKWALAEKDLRMALELKPDQPDVLNYLGFGWLERGIHIDEARDMIARAVKARPDDAQIVDSMGWALYMEGDYTASAPYLEKAVELLPGDPTVNDHLGDVYWRLGRKNEARFQWQRSLTFSPELKVAETIHRKLKEGLPPVHVAGRNLSSDESIDKPAVSATP